MQSDRSQLFDSLKSYLNNQSRLQPIIGLGSIIECVNVSSDGRETLYLCEVCVCRVTKADIRNHILGSHHRFNYIKACHPHLAWKWRENEDLSKLAWQMMELAKILERKEGPGLVQLFEVPDGVYQKLAAEKENHAVTLINAMRDEHDSNHAFDSQRIVLHTELHPPNNSVSQLENTQTSPEFSVSPEDDSLDRPLIGLVHVVEIRSDNGSSHCFLCHCCRIKSNTRDFYDHLTSSSHLFNYLMETHPDLVQDISDGPEADLHLLRLLADSVERQEGRGELKIVNVPESFCRQLTGKSYHWCLRMQANGWTCTDIPQKKEAVKGVNKSLMSRKIPVVSKLAKRKAARKKKTNTMFNVSLPLREGDMLVERTSFNEDSLLESSSPPVCVVDPVVSLPHHELKSDSGSFEVSHPELPSELQPSQLEQNLYGGEGDYVPDEQIKITVFQNAGDGVHVNQSAQEPETERRLDTSEHGAQRLGNQFYQNWDNVKLQEECEGGFPHVSHTRNLSCYSSYYRHEEGDGWYGSVLPSEGRGNDISFCAARQQYQNQQMLRGDAGLHAGHMWGQHDLSSEIDYLIDAARTNVQTCSGPPFVLSGSFSSAPQAPFHNAELRPSQTHPAFNMTHLHMAPQSYMTQSQTYQISQSDQSLMFPTNSYSPGYGADPGQHCVFPGFMQPNAFIEPEQAAFYGGVYFRAGVQN